MAMILNFTMKYLCLCKNVESNNHLRGLQSVALVSNQGIIVYYCAI